MASLPGQYHFEQDENTVTLFVFVPEGTRGRDVRVTYPTARSLEVLWRGAPIVAGALFGAVRRSECTWSVDGEELRITLAKVVETVSEATGWTFAVDGTEWHAPGEAPEGDADAGEGWVEVLLLRFIVAVAAAHIAYATRPAGPAVRTAWGFVRWTVAVAQEEFAAIAWPRATAGGVLSVARAGVAGGMGALVLGLLQQPRQWLAVHGAGVALNIACVVLGAPFAAEGREAWAAWVHMVVGVGSLLSMGATLYFVQVRLARLKAEHQAAVRKAR